MSEEIIKVLDHLGEKFGIVIDWTNENAMPYLQDLLQRIVLYNAVANSLWILFGIILIVLAILLFRYGNKKSKDRYWDWDVEGTWIIVLGSVLGMLGFALIVGGIPHLLEGIFLPEKVALEMISGEI